MRFVPIEEAEQQQGLKFVPIEESATPPLATASATPAVADTSGLDGGAASKTVLDGGAAFGVYPKALPSRNVEVPAQTGGSVMGPMPAPTPLPTGVNQSYVEQIRREMLRATPAQRVAMMNEGGMKSNVAKFLAETETASFRPRKDRLAETPLPTQIGMDLRKNIKNPAALGVVSGLAGLGQVIPGAVQFGADLVGADDLARAAGNAASAGRQLQEPLRPSAGNDKLVFDVFNSVIQSTPTMLMGLANGPAMTTLFAQTGAQEYSEGRAHGFGVGESTARAGIMASAEVLGERFGFGEQMKLMRGMVKGMPTNEIAPTLARQIVKEVPGEQLTTLIQFLGDKYGPAALNPTGTLEQYLNQAGDTLKTTIGQTALMAGGPAAVRGTRNAYKKIDEQQLANNPEYQLAKALQESVDNTQVNQDATRQAAVQSLNPDNAQYKFVPLAEVERQPTPDFHPHADPQSPEAVAANDAKNSDRLMLAKLVQRGIDDGKGEDEIVAQAAQLFNQSISPGDVEFVRQSVQAAAQPKEQPAPASVSTEPSAPQAAPAPSAGDTQRVSTVTGRQIETRMRVIDASELKPATGDLQPRDRSRAASDEQINTIASQLDPQRLGHSAEADRGAPIIGPDMIVESGNGRVMSIRRAFEMFPEKAQAYRDYLKSQGYDTEGINMPVLVRERVTPLSPQERVAFVQESNQSSTMDLTPVERAKIDVSALKDSVVDVWGGGDISSAANRDFVRAFIGQLPQAQRNGMLDDHGNVSPDGVTRIRRALLAAAYDDRELLAKLIDSTDDNIKSVGNALFDSAPAWLQMRRLARDGIIPAHYDVTQDLVAAARTVDQLRQTKSRVQEWLAQNDMVSERNPIVDEFVRAFYNEDLSRAVGRDAINDVLKAYVDYAKRQDTEDLLGGSPPSPQELTRSAVEQRNERNRKPDNGTLFDAEASSQPSSDGSVEQSVHEGGAGKVAPFVRRVGQTLGGRSSASPLLDTAGGGRTSDEAGQGSADSTKQGDVNERTGGLDGNDQGSSSPSRQRGSKDDGPAKSQRVKGTGQDSLFRKVSFTDRQSIYRDAFVELGYDPAEAELLPPARQFKILSDGLKNTYGLAFVQKSEKANVRDSIDQLLDAYRGLQLMSHVLDLPSSAVGLNGTLGLAMTSRGDFLGAYFPQGTGGGGHTEGIKSAVPTIAMPGRSNSFAHEWGHALDYHLLTSLEGITDTLSGYIRSGESFSDKTPDNVRDAFRLLMNTMFFDQAEQSGKIMDLERKIEAAEQKGQDASKLKADLERIVAGASKSRNDRSQFYKNAGEFAKATGSDPDYWRKPTEMLARSFEAYVSHKVEAAGGSTEFIGKGDAAYSSEAEIRLAKTFPKDSDRFNIFRAYDMLFDALREQALLNPDGELTATLPNNVRLSDPSVYFADQQRSAQSTGLRAMWDAEKRAWVVRQREHEKLALRPNDDRPLVKRMGDYVRAAVETNRGVLLSMESHYRNQGNLAAAKAIRQVTERLATNPGAGQETGSGGTYAEAVERETRRLLTRLSNIAGNHEADLLSDAELAELTSLLTQDENDSMQTASDKTMKLAAKLRELMTDVYYYNRNAGLDIGFVKDQGYLPRLIDEPLVTANDAEFVKDATEVYKIVFERDTERPMEADDISLALDALDKRIKEAELVGAPELKQYRDAKKELYKLLRQLEAANNAEEDTEDKADKAQAEIKEFLDDNADVFEEAYDYVRDQWSAKAAAEYQVRISFGSPTDFSSHSPAGSFLKGRSLPPEADKILAKYYIQDPIERITSYIQASVRKSEFNTRFGKDARNSKETNTKLHRMLEAMVNAGVRKNDRDMVQKIVGQVTGTDRSQLPDELNRSLGFVHAIGQMTLLGRVVLTSLAEPMTVALQTGKPLDALKGLALTIQEIANNGSVRERRAMGRVLGIVSGDLADEMISNRLGGTVVESTAMNRASANFFRRVGLTGLTNAQRRASMQLAGSYVMELAQILDDDTASQRDKGFARDELIDAGMRGAQLQDFVNWSREFTGRVPRHDEVMDVDGSLTEMGKLYAVMVGRLVNQAIQSPTAIDRPYASNTSVGRLVYGLLSFSMAFFRNVAVKSFKKVNREYERGGKAYAAQVAATQVIAPLASLYLGHLLVTIAREALLNPEKWDEEEKVEGGFPIKWLMSLAFSRAGFTGLADPIYNAVTGVKYQRDLSNILGGATGSYFFQAIERIAKFFVLNSDSTNNAERGAVRGMYELIAQPGLAYATGYLPGGPMVGAGLGASYMYMSSPAFKAQLQDWFAGEKEGKQKKAGEKAGEQGVF